MSAKPVYESVEGSPYQPKEKVIVLGFSDETGDQEFIGKTGTVEYLEFSCGCGQAYPNDPMIGIRFPDGSLIECWSEEIAKVKQTHKEKKWHIFAYGTNGRPCDFWADTQKEARELYRKLDVRDYPDARVYIEDGDTEDFRWGRGEYPL